VPLSEELIDDLHLFVGDHHVRRFDRSVSVKMMIVNRLLTRSWVKKAAPMTFSLQDSGYPAKSSSIVSSDA
jgi:hypothetical protein